MDKRIIAEIDAQIRQLQLARKLLIGLNIGSRVARARATGRKKLSAAARARISAAQKKRWAKVWASAAKK